MSRVPRSRRPRRRPLALAYAASLGLVGVALLRPFVHSHTSGRARPGKVTFASYLARFA